MHIIERTSRPGSPVPGRSWRVPDPAYRGHVPRARRERWWPQVSAFGDRLLDGPTLRQRWVMAPVRSTRECPGLLDLPVHAGRHHPL